MRELKSNAVQLGDYSLTGDSWQNEDCTCKRKAFRETVNSEVWIDIIFWRTCLDLPKTISDKKTWHTSGSKDTQVQILQVMWFTRFIMSLNDQ